MIKFNVQILCIGHRRPAVITSCHFDSMRGVEAFFDTFGVAYTGKRCAYHSHQMLIPRLAGAINGGAA